MSRAGAEGNMTALCRLSVLLVASMASTVHAFCSNALSPVRRVPFHRHSCTFPIMASPLYARTGTGVDGLKLQGTRRGFLAGAAVLATVPNLPSQVAAYGSGSGLDNTLGVLGLGVFPSERPVEGLVSVFRRRIDKGFISERRPKPVKLPRTSLYRPFAVLLMRSCYEAADMLDFIPMNEFQREFFLLRQNQWEKYLIENDSKQGDLSDAKYFDFISAAQFATITRAMENGQQIFEELVGAEGEKTVVKYASNDLLPVNFYRVVGDLVYTGLLADYTGPKFFTQPPVPCPEGNNDCVTRGLKQLYTVIGENGFAMEIQVAEGGVVTGKEYQAEIDKLDKWRQLTEDTATQKLAGQGIKIVVSLQAPCNLWGRQWLGFQGYIPTDHDVMIATEYLRRCNRPVTVNTRTTENSIVREYVIL